MGSRVNLSRQDLLTVPSTRLPIVLCLDASGSMSGEPVKELNIGIELFFKELRRHPDTRHSAEVGVIVFHKSTEVLAEFMALDRIVIPVVNIDEDTRAGTDLGNGVGTAIDHLEVRQRDYERVGVDYFAPILVLMSDGKPTTNTHHAAASRVTSLEAGGALKILPIGIGAGADLSVLSCFSTKHPALRLKDLAFVDFFEKFSRCVIRVSQSRPDENVPLFTSEEIKSWADMSK